MAHVKSEVAKIEERLNASAKQLAELKG